MEILLVLQVIVVVALVGMILLQKSSSDGFTGNSSPTSFMSGKAQANLFTRITGILAAVFMLNSLLLAYLASHSDRQGSVIDSIEIEETTTGTGNETDSLLESIRVEGEGVANEAKESIENTAEKATEALTETIQENKSDEQPAVPLAD